MDIKEFLQIAFTIAGIKAPWISWGAALAACRANDR